MNQLDLTCEEHIDKLWSTAVKERNRKVDKTKKIERSFDKKKIRKTLENLTEELQRMVEDI